MTKFNSIALGLCAAIAGGCSQANPQIAVPNSWICSPISYGERPIKVSADPNEGVGHIHLISPAITTRFALEGLESRWDWKNYSFRVRGNGTANYYDFADENHKNDNGTSSPKLKFSCVNETKAAPSN